MFTLQMDKQSWLILTQSSSTAFSTTADPCEVLTRTAFVHFFSLWLDPSCSFWGSLLVILGGQLLSPEGQMGPFCCCLTFRKSQADSLTFEHPLSDIWTSTVGHLDIHCRTFGHPLSDIWTSTVRHLDIHCRTFGHPLSDIWTSTVGHLNIHCRTFGHSLSDIQTSVVRHLDICCQSI